MHALSAIVGHSQITTRLLRGLYFDENYEWLQIDGSDVVGHSEEQQQQQFYLA